MALSKDDIDLLVHDLRSPFTVIKIYLELTEKQLSSSEDQKTVSYLRTIGAKSDQILQTVSTIRDFLNYQNNLLPSEPSTINMADFIARFLKVNPDIIYFPSALTTSLPLSPSLLEVLFNCLKNYLVMRSGNQKLMIIIKPVGPDLLINFSAGLSSPRRLINPRLSSRRGDLPKSTIESLLAFKIIADLKGKLLFTSSGSRTIAAFTLPIFK